MMYGWSQYATGSGIPGGGWFIPMPMMGYLGTAGSSQTVTSCPAAIPGWGSNLMLVASLLYLFTWLLLVVVLIAAARYFWLKAGK